MRRRDPRARLLAVVLAGALAGGVQVVDVAAQPEPGGDEPSEAPNLEEALRLSELGRLHYEGGEFAEAAAAFARAFELAPEPVLGYNAARSYENAGEPGAALAVYQAVLALDFDDAEMRQRCQDGVQRIENILGRLEQERLRQPARLSLDSLPAGATVLVEGEPRGETPLEVELQAGTYTVDLVLEGHDSYRETVSLNPAQAVALRVNLPETPLPPPPPEDGGPTWWAVGLTGGIGVVLVLLGAGAAVGAHDRFDQLETAEVQRDQERFDSVREEGENLRGASTLSYGLGFTFLATAVLLYFVTDDSGEEVGDSAALDVGVGLGPDGAGASVGWRF